MGHLNNLEHLHNMEHIQRASKDFKISQLSIKVRLLSNMGNLILIISKHHKDT